MSSYTKIEIITDKIKLTDELIKTLENLTGSFWYGFEGLEQKISKNYLEYYKAFNNNFEKAICVLKSIEKCLICFDKAEKIGELDSESYFSDSNRDIFLYKGKIYLVGFDYDSTIRNTYFISDLNLNRQTIEIENDKSTMGQIIEKYLVENSLRYLTYMIKIEDLEKYSNKQLFKIHKDIYDCIENIKVLKFDGVNPYLYKREKISNAKKDLELVASILKNRKLSIPAYGLIWKIKQLLLRK